VSDLGRAPGAELGVAAARRALPRWALSRLFLADAPCKRFGPDTRNIAAIDRPSRIGGLRLDLGRLSVRNTLSKNSRDTAPPWAMARAGTSGHDHGTDRRHRPQHRPAPRTTAPTGGTNGSAAQRGLTRVESDDYTRARSVRLMPCSNQFARDLPASTGGPLLSWSQDPVEGRQRAAQRSRTAPTAPASTRSASFADGGTPSWCAPPTRGTDPPRGGRCST
jgi:hypothetical protein